MFRPAAPRRGSRDHSPNGTSRVFEFVTLRPDCSMVGLLRWDRPMGVPAFSAADVRAELNVASGEEEEDDDVDEAVAADDVDDGSRLLPPPPPPPPPPPLRRGRREMGPKSAISQYPFAFRCLYTPLYTWPQS